MIGIDVIKIDRIDRFKKRFGNKALKKFLDKDEIKLASSSTSHAGYWAAKEAISKALGVGISRTCSFYDIKIYKDNKNAPNFTLSSHLIEKFKITDVALSITHDGEYSIAVAFIESKLKRDNTLFH
ncbi:MAG: holo-ACP synthase [Sulfurospirillum sp.]|nr:holo-ACP synthase [Sulfurospirillum sp.]MBL0702960.1 holo-ACP synthase [Sulfurospirillum sp.]